MFSAEEGSRTMRTSSPLLVLAAFLAIAATPASAASITRPGMTVTGPATNVSFTFGAATATCTASSLTFTTPKSGGAASIYFAGTDAAFGGCTIAGKAATVTVAPAVWTFAVGKALDAPANASWEVSLATSQITIAAAGGFCTVTLTATPSPATYTNAASALAVADSTVAFTRTGDASCGPASGATGSFKGTYSFAASLMAITENNSSGWTLGSCKGGGISGSGSAFQTRAQLVWMSDFNAVQCEDAGIGFSWSATGSGIGHSRFRDRWFDLAAFAGTSNAPAAGAAGRATTVARIEQGAGGVADVNARLLVIPIASGAIAVVVNTPANCAIDGGETSLDGRAAITKLELEDVYAGTIGQWSQLAAFDGTATCKVDIVRGARLDNSGTTAQFKLFLETVDRVDGSDDVPWDTLGNTSWPATVSKPAFVGGSELAKLVDTTDASVGYVVATDALAKFDTDPTDTEYYLALRSDTPTSTTATWENPTTGTKSRCDGATYARLSGGGPPSTTYRESGWSDVIGFNTAGGVYPICSLTYALAWRDAKDVSNPSGTINQYRQRTVSDYLKFVTGAVGQALAETEHYTALPAAILRTARKGA